MNPQLRGHSAAVEPELNSVLFKGLVKLLSDLLGLNHRCIHICFFFLCLSLPVSVKSAQPHFAYFAVKKVFLGEDLGEFSALIDILVYFDCRENARG